MKLPQPLRIVTEGARLLGATLLSIGLSAVLILVLPWAAILTEPREARPRLPDEIINAAVLIANRFGSMFVLGHGLLLAGAATKYALRIHYGLWARRERLLWMGALALLCLCAPIFFSEYRLFQGTKFFCYCIILLGINLLTGYAGQISFGHGAFALIGAYVTGVLVSGRAGAPWPQPLAILCAAAVATVAGIALGVPSLRLRGPYLALATMGLAVAAPLLVKSSALARYTGASSGLSVPHLTPPASLGCGVATWGYEVALALAAAGMLGLHNLLRSRAGRALKMVRESEEAAQSVGIGVSGAKLLAFALSAFAAGLGGALLACTVGFISPSSYDLLVAIDLLAAAVTGGLGRLLGVLLAATYMTAQPALTGALSHLVPSGEHLIGVVSGGLLVAMMIWAPKGLAAVLYKDGRWLLSAPAIDRYWIIARELQDVAKDIPSR